jgi:hypothetical protein
VGEAQQNVVTHGHLGDALAHRINYSGAFVTQHCGKRGGVPLVANNRICVTYATRHHLDAHLTRARLVEIKLGHDERLFFLKRYGGSGLHGGLLDECRMGLAKS